MSQEELLAQYERNRAQVERHRVQIESQIESRIQHAQAHQVGALLRMIEELTATVSKLVKFVSEMSQDQEELAARVDLEDSRYGFSPN